MPIAAEELSLEQSVRLLAQFIRSLPQQFLVGLLVGLAAAPLVELGQLIFQCVRRQRRLNRQRPVDVLREY